MDLLLEHQLGLKHNFGEFKWSQKSQRHKKRLTLKTWNFETVLSNRFHKGWKVVRDLISQKKIIKNGHHLVPAPRARGTRVFASTSNVVGGRRWCRRRSSGCPVVLAKPADAKAFWKSNIYITIPLKMVVTFN